MSCVVIMRGDEKLEIKLHRVCALKNLKSYIGNYGTLLIILKSFVSLAEL